MNPRERAEFRRELEMFVREMAGEVDAVVVEGPRDRAALRALGWEGPALLASGSGKGRADFVDSVSERYRTVALLTDFDGAGRALAARLRARLERSGVKVAPEWRNRLRALLGGTGCRTVEGLKRFAGERCPEPFKATPRPSVMHLTGKVAVVTGAGQGIGRGEALLLAKEGAFVVVNDLGTSWEGEGKGERFADSVVQEIKAAGGRAVPNFDDVSKWDGARSIINTALESFGRLDIVVNNAGILRDKMIFSMEEPDFDAVIGVHLKGTFGMTRHACAHFKEAHKEGKLKAGRIINTTSIVALKGNLGQTNYIAAKGGIAALTLGTAIDMARYGVTCNAISPAARTRLIDETYKRKGSSAAARMPAGRDYDPYAPENIAPLVAYLATDAAQSVTGQVFHVVGGQIELFRGWTSARTIKKPGRWEVGELEKKLKELLPEPAVAGKQDLLAKF